jgi:hypothetical protein
MADDTLPDREPDPIETKTHADSVHVEPAALEEDAVPPDTSVPPKVGDEPVPQSLDVGPTVSTDMSYCQNCGVDCDPGRADCPECGYILDGGRAIPDGFFTCPHCKRTIEMLEKNCGIFICGVDRRTHKPVNPHDEAGAAKLLEDGFLIGCSKQFRLDAAAGKMVPCTGK